MNLYIYLYYKSELNQKYDDECSNKKDIVQRITHFVDDRRIYYKAAYLAW